jgi:hypothetical protein
MCGCLRRRALSRARVTGSRAAALRCRWAAQLRAKGGDAALKFMVEGSYVVSLYLSCPPGMGLHCPNATARAEFIGAVQRGDILWPAFPFNAELEMYDAGMVSFGFQMTHQLDAMLGLPVRGGPARAAPCGDCMRVSCRRRR